MARRKPAEGEAVATPVYTVVKIKRLTSATGEQLSAGDTLEVIANAPSQAGPLGATEAVVDGLPEDERVGEFGGFLARNLKADEWITRTQVITGRRGVIDGPEPEPDSAPEPDPELDPVAA